MTTAVHDRLIPNFDTQLANANSTTLEERVNASAHDEINRSVIIHREAFLAYNTAAFKRNCSLVAGITFVAMYVLGIVIHDLTLVIVSTLICIKSIAIFFNNRYPYFAEVSGYRAAMERRLNDADNGIPRPRYADEYLPHGNNKTCLGGFFWKYYVFKSGEMQKLASPLHILIPIMQEREFNKIMEV
ncbi:MAG: hypothetical protein COT84_02085 [Chlamydiae bacterium CG10_big_fil_rev_8_21_14_0_10_35_9]|nr:MAG: hypothetical protein COT84_02085 [Chlamydiae bacterium CG10_big_fil_rev_8_21_14_0_10_35_9]